MNEQELVNLYMKITGTSEPAARNVFMMVCSSIKDTQRANGSNGHKTNGHPDENPPLPRFHIPAIVLVLLSFCLLTDAIAATSAPTDSAPSAPHEFGGPLSLADAVNLALLQNPAILRAQKDIAAAKGIAIQTRAIALPSLGVASDYAASQHTDIDQLHAGPFTFGTPQNWSTQVKLVQSLYQGGRMLSAFRAAELTRDQSLLNYQTAIADTVLNVQLVYYDVLLAAQQISVQEASVLLLTNELSDTTRRFEAGTVPRFNVLRAEVELANARPKLINARNQFRISKNNLANLLGLNLPSGIREDIPLVLSDKLVEEPLDLEFSDAIAQALERRSEMGALRKAEALRKEDLVTAKAGYKPVIQGYVGYDVHNSLLSSDLMDTREGWIAGVQLTWNIFDGLATQGRIRQATANYERAGVDLDDKMRAIGLEVRTAYSGFIDAREVLDSQKKVVEVAEEALRLARARSEAGTGTQLDVLSAQTALTEARTTQIQALHDYEAARARLLRAAGVNIPREQK